MIKNIISTSVTAVIVTILTVALFVGPQPENVTEKPTFSSSIQTVKQILGQGAEITNGPRDGGLIFKGILSKAISGTTATLSAGEIVANNTIAITAAVPGVSVTLPASTTFPSSFLPRPGDRTRIVILNATSTTGNNSQVGFLAGAGALLQVASTTPAGTATTTGKTGATIDILRKPDTDLLFLLTTFK